jgi:hypothetical protein
MTRVFTKVQPLLNPNKMKNKFSKTVNALGGITKYSGKTRTMYVHKLDEVHATALSIEFTGVVLPFKVVFQ